MRRWNSKIYISRPPARCKGARMAWDILSRRDDGQTPETMWHCFLDYWVWVMKFTNGEYEEVDGLVVTFYVNNPRKHAKEEEK